VCLLGAQLPAPRPDGDAVLRGRPNRGDLEHRDDADAKACFGFAAGERQIDLRDRASRRRTVYAGIGWEVPRLLDPMPADWYFDIAAQVDMADWARRRVVLVGDAAYCASPMSGQGSSLALIGAYVLAGELAAAGGDHDAAFAEYDRVIRPFIAVNQVLGIRRAPRSSPPGARSSR
jgi:2-polyprenyl-6-methoxyphenol hydroxylase-like FAD-dependent oxidoreductase